MELKRGFLNATDSPCAQGVVMRFSKVKESRELKDEMEQQRESQNHEGKKEQVKRRRRKTGMTCETQECPFNVPAAS